MYAATTTSSLLGMSPLRQRTEGSAPPGPSRCKFALLDATHATHNLITPRRLLGSLCGWGAVVQRFGLLTWTVCGPTFLLAFDHPFFRIPLAQTGRPCPVDPASRSTEEA